MDLELRTNAEHRAEKSQELTAFKLLNLRGVRGSVDEALKHIGRLNILDEYTKHDMSHIDAMLELYDWLIPPATADAMTPADWLLVTLSTYLHDFGLLVTRDEYDERAIRTGFEDFCRVISQANAENDSWAADYRAYAETLEDEAAKKFLYQEWVRSNHAPRIRNWLSTPPDYSLGGDPKVVEHLQHILSGIDEDFRHDVAIVCESHHLDDLDDEEKYPSNKPYGPTAREEANVQYAALLLRTADLMHVTMDRVPSVAALIINPRNPKSQTEWAKQAAVKRVRPREEATDEAGNSHPEETIEVHALFTEADGYFGLTQYLKYATKQLAQNFDWCRTREGRAAGRYSYPWRRIDTSNIRAKGFVTEQFKFTLDQDKILELLTGHTLYNDSHVAVRELLQNALDAVRLKKYILDEQSGTHSFEPTIEVEWDAASKRLTVTDNGVGMTEDTIRNNFLRAGSSGYRSEEFARTYPDFSPISRFGIGVLSTFMIADDVSVITNHATESQCRQLNLRDVHGNYLVRVLDKNDDRIPPLLSDSGTSVTLELRASTETLDLLEILRRWVLIPECTVRLKSGSKTFAIGYSDSPSALRAEMLTAGLVREDPDGHLRDGLKNEVQIRSFPQDDLDLAIATKWNRWVQDWEFINVPDTSRSEQTLRLGTCVNGVRVTEQSPGYSHSGILAIANFVGKGAPKTNVARSAMERNEEYERVATAIYSSYVSHITEESDSLESERGASKTRAATEAGYLASSLFRGVVEYPNRLKSELKSVPAFVIETSGNRRRVPLNSLESEASLVTVESATVSSLESVLHSARGANNSSSLAAFVDALGISDPIEEGSTALCGPSNSGGSNPFTAIFNETYCVSSIEVLDEKRTLRTTWVRQEENFRWAVPDMREIPTQLRRRIDAEVQFTRQNDSLDRFLFARAETSIETHGFSERIVRSRGRTLVLPGHPLFDVAPASTEVPAGAVIAVMAWLASFLVRSNQANLSERAIENLLEQVSRSGLSELVSPDSVADALSKSDVAAVLDVMRWDRRTSDN